MLDCCKCQSHRIYTCGLMCHRVWCMCDCKAILDWWFNVETFVPVAVSEPEDESFDSHSDTDETQNTATDYLLSEDESLN